MKYIKYLLCFFLLSTPFFANAVELPENNSWSWKHHEKTREQARLKAHLVKQINESGSKKAVDAIVETRPTASKVGGVMFKRLMSSAGGKMLGVYAVTELIEGIGWVMEEGTYVKKIKEEGVPDCGSNFYYKNSEAFSRYGNSSLVCTTGEAKAQASRYFSNDKTKFVSTCTLKLNSTISCVWGYEGESNPDRLFDFSKVTHNEPVAKEKTVPLTPALLGAAMLGQGYKDPDPNFNNDTVNTDKWTSVPDSYTPDPSGVGNELADELEKKADAAPDTPDGKPSGLSDPRYTNDLESNDAANDRSWESGDGTQGSTDSSTSTDPETGETTQTGTFKLPAFCDWAMTVCEWYEGWKKTDTKVNEHIDEEKSFWQTVKDWFDWTKEPLEEEPEQEEPEIDDQGIFNRTFDYVFSLSSECPADIPFELNTEYLSGSFSISLRWLCIIFTVLGYPLVFVSHCIGMWILYETVVRKELKW